MSNVAPLLATKLHIPRPPAGRNAPPLVSRGRLNTRLDAGLDCKLTLICAPAGFGKTSLVVDWLRGRQSRSQDAAAPAPVDVGWLSLDEGDNDPARFVSYINAALQPSLPHLAELPATPPPATPEARLTLLINAISGRDNDMALVLDDYHVTTAPAIHCALAFLLNHLPPQCHLFVTTRSDPPLPLARLRSQCQMIELRTNELRFTRDETTVFLNERMRLNLAPADVAALEARTEGWGAGLQLAALSLQGQPNPSRFVATFGGAHPYVMSYLAEEILSRQPDAIQAFLLQTAVLDRLSGPLCDAVLGQTASPAMTPDHLPANGQATLAYLERANLFLIPLDEEGRWFRYHHLFAAALAAQLRQKFPERIPDLHHRAGEWFAQHGLLDEAIQHALAAGDVECGAGRPERLPRDPQKRGELITLSPPAGGAPLVETLSCRELETLRLVAAGLSNRQIAAELIVTVGTVKRHLNNIYGKLNVASRTQALARAAELALL